MNNLIVFIGMMGSGKTTVGKLLAENLGYSFFDIDKEIEKTENKTISEIFKEKGEQYFREIEAKKIKEFVNLQKSIISLGGGAFERIETQEILKDKITIYLKANAETIYERIKKEEHRPLLKDNISVEKINSILRKRLENYEKARYEIDTNNKTPQEITEEILGVMK